LIPVSSTKEIPEVSAIPKHVAIIMDGNGRWATQRHLPRSAGHAKGIPAVRNSVEHCGQMGVKYLTLFAFSSENWRRPEDEVTLLMKLFMQALEREVSQLKQQGVRLRVVGDLSRFDAKLRSMIDRAQMSTQDNDTMHLTIAANYGGRWDVLQAIQKMLKANPSLATGDAPIAEDLFTPHLSMAWAPEPDLFIRTGGEQRISNFLIWQLAYTELYFTERFWPEFTKADLDDAFYWYGQRERRFGRTSAQIPALTMARSV